MEIAVTMVALLAVFVLGMTITFPVCNGVLSKAQRRSGLHPVEILPIRYVSQDELFRPLYYKRLRAARQKPLEEESPKNQQTIKIEVTSTALHDSKPSDKCHGYETLIKAKISVEYFNDPVQHLKAEYKKINIYSEPGERYYTLVLKVNKAVEEEILIPIAGTYERGKNGIVTQSYQVLKDNTKLRLVSHLALPQANAYFRRKVDSDCVALSDEGIRAKNRNVQSHNEGQRQIASSLTVSDRNTEKYSLDQSRDCYPIQRVEDLKAGMDKININSEPGSLYFKVVLDVYKAVACNILLAIADTMSTGLRGIHTELYRVVADNSNVRLASISDRYKAWAFLKARNSALNGRGAQLEISPRKDQNSNNMKPEVLRLDSHLLRQMRGGGKKVVGIHTIKTKLQELSKSY